MNMRLILNEDNRYDDFALVVLVFLTPFYSLYTFLLG